MCCMSKVCCSNVQIWFLGTANDLSHNKSLSYTKTSYEKPIKVADGQREGITKEL